MGKTIKLVEEDDIFDEYLFYQTKYEKIYGKDKTFTLMMVGGFYEAYTGDTKGPKLEPIAELLNIVMARKNKKLPPSDKNPYMMGFPIAALNKFMRVLINNGYNVVIIDQLEPSVKGRTVKRGVTGVYSSGTYIDETFSPDSNDIIVLYIEDELQRNGKILTCIGMSCVDLTTGKSFVHEAYSVIDDDKLALDEAVLFINSFNAKEILIYRKELNNKNNIHGLLDKNQLLLYLELESKNFYYHETINKNYCKISYQNEVLSRIYKDIGMMTPIEYLDLEKKQYTTISFVALMDFAFQHNENIINNVMKPLIYHNEKELILGNNALYQLNIFDHSTDSMNGTKYKSLFDVINCTSTAMGRRFLKNALRSPLINIQQIQYRYDCIDDIINNNLYEIFDQHLKNIIDIERAQRKIALKCLHPFVLTNVIASYSEIIKTKYIKNILPNHKIINEFMLMYDEFNKLFDLDVLSKYNINDIQSSFFAKNIHPHIDQIQNEIDLDDNKLHELAKELSSYIDNSDKKKKKEKENVNELISVASSDKQGYFLKLTKSRANMLKKYITDNEIQEIILNNNFNVQINNIKYKELEKGSTKLFSNEIDNVSDNLRKHVDDMMCAMKDEYVKYLDVTYNKYKNVMNEMVRFISELDYIKSCAKAAKLYNYVKPTIVQSDSGFVKCKQLRHPLVERINTDIEYIPHDISLGDPKDSSEYINGMLLYGLNSSGKSTLMKAIGTSIIMAQAGMYVPAIEYKFSPYNSMYGRITGNDNILKGLSSFALEMTELRAILKRAGQKTLVIGDEVCRGTEYISGNSLVAATIIKLAKTGSSFIFASHLHEIPKMEKIKELKNVKSFHLTVEHDEERDLLVFDRQLKEGSGTTMYGITVARYIIQDNEFIRLSQEIKNELLKVPNTIVNNKTSRYNANLYINNCVYCGQKVTIDKYGGYIDTHHINEQRNCKNGFVVDKPHIKMNSKANLAPLCKECHKNQDIDKSKIVGYEFTSNGRKIKIKK